MPASPSLYFPAALPLPSRVEAEDLGGCAQNIPADRLAEYLGRADGDPVKPAKKRRGFFCLKSGKNWHNTKLRREKFAKVCAVGRYIFTAKKRGWMGAAETDESLFAHACRAVFGSEQAYKSPRKNRDLRKRAFAVCDLFFLGQKPTPPQVYIRKATPSVKEGENKTHSDAPSPAPAADSRNSDRLTRAAAPLSVGSGKAGLADGKGATPTPGKISGPAPIAAFVGLLRKHAAAFEAAHTEGEARRIRFNFGLLARWGSKALENGAELAGLVKAYARTVREHGERAKAHGAAMWEPSGMAPHLAAAFALAPKLDLMARADLRRAAAEEKTRRTAWAAMMRRADIAEAARKAVESADRRAGLDADTLRAASADRATTTRGAADLFNFNFALAA